MGVVDLRDLAHAPIGRDRFLTRHAYERFCERFYPASWDEVRDLLITDQMISWIRFGVEKIHNHELRATIVVRDGKVATIHPIKRRGH